MKGPWPTREIVDDYFGILDAQLCTRECGAADGGVCKCRCGGEFHNLLRDWWASPECAASTWKPGDRVIVRLPDHRLECLLNIGLFVSRRCHQHVR